MGYIAADNPEAAGRVREEIQNAIRGLVSLPDQGHKRPDLTSRPLRFVIVRDYLIAYAPQEKPLWVVAVLHGRPSFFSFSDAHLEPFQWLTTLIDGHERSTEDVAPIK